MLLRVLIAQERERETALSHYGRIFNALAITEVAANSFGWRLNECTEITERLFRGSTTYTQTTWK